MAKLTHSPSVAPKGVVSLALGLFLVVLSPNVSLAQAGALDTSFDGDGKVTTDFTGSSDQVWSVAIQADGKIVAAGLTFSGIDFDYDFALTRYNADGSLDTGFDGDGKVTTDFGTFDWARSVAIQPDGKIVVAGKTRVSGADYDFALARYNADGSLDTSFDGDGKLTTDFSAGDDESWSVAIQADGKIVAVGYSYSSSAFFNFAVVRYNADGSLDTSFDGDGKLTTDFPGSTDQARSVAIQVDGKIVVAGRAFATWRGYAFALARYNADGTLDTGFDGDGKLITDFAGSDDDAWSVAIQPDGKIVVAGRALGTASDFAVARYLGDGSLDSSFDGDGTLLTDFAGGNDYAGSVVIQADGKIVVVGHAYVAPGGDFALARYHADGSLDTSFDSDGKVNTDFGGNDESAYSVAIQADGKIIAAGRAFGSSSASLDFGVARYDHTASALIVTKVVVNDDGGAKTIGDFPLFVDGSPVTSGDENTFSVGVHTVSETADPGYAATIGGDCAADGTITLNPGDVKSCTITNNDIAPKLTVTKVVVNDDGGAKTIGDFPLFVDGSPVTSGDENTFSAGVHTVTETVDPGYAATIGGDCAADGTITLNPGDVKSCTITNNDIAPKLTVTKVVVNDDGGAKTIGDFPLFVDGSPVTSGDENTFSVGFHTVSETADPGYAATIGGDCAADGSITLNPGDAKNCTITNDDIAPPNTPPLADAGGPYGGNEGAAIALGGASASDPDSDPLTLSWSVDTPLLCSFSNDTVLNPDLTCTDNGIFTVTLTADDGTAAPVSSDATVTVDNVDPSVDPFSVPADPIEINDQPVAGVSTTFTDPGTADTHTCTVNYGDGLQAGTINAGNCEGPDHTYAEAGVFEVNIEVTDDDDGTGSATASEFIVVYDPEGGFVTGGGWIQSPDGACPLFCNDATGKANFGFVSKYKNGASVPTGQTEFNFKAGDLNFHSSSYDWLVIAGAKAMYKGDGTVNGDDGFTFQLNAIDGQRPGGGEVDKFRIKIKQAGGGVIYDNQMGAADNDEPTTAIGGGSIKIHKEGGSGKVEEIADVPLEFALHPNYPNPFNPTTTISYALPKAADVTLGVFDVLGRQVRVLASGRHQAGRYEVTFNSSLLPSGVFLYRLEAGDFVQTKRMVMVK